MLSSTRESIDSVEFIYCGCGCGFTRSKHAIENGRIRKDRIYRYIPSHHRRNGKPTNLGRIFSDTWRKNMSLVRIGKLNRPLKNWNELCYTQKHRRMKKMMKKPDLCQICLTLPAKELANKTYQYLEDENDWFYLCIKCHRKFDNIGFKGWITKRKKKLSLVYSVIGFFF